MNSKNGFSNTMGREYTDEQQEVCDEITEFVTEVMDDYVGDDGTLDSERLLADTMTEFNGEYGYTTGNICTDVVEYATKQHAAGKTVAELSSDLVGR